ncbi:hypothetical protein Zmor_021915 [Zophobas morio]|uniref:Nucleolus and neural progenitor protein-like N-terminal domain-containing protein n=1 Tax=Zophobas morio TaxID=2755281 RepID=A0AA38MBH4_9CUCU|nr:hypothetical protein Zmor_021915 [Zophobas morio]
MDLWNIKDLEPPPVTSCKACTKQIDVRLLHAVLQEGVNFFSNQHHLFTEAALLSRSVYRFKVKFRSSKDFKIVEKLNHILRTYQRMHISAALNVLLVTIPQNYKANNTYMLTKNMFDYVLVRLQGVGKLLCATLEACKEVSTAMQQRLRLGHFWKVAIVIFATAARVFVVAKNALKYCCELYGNLLPYSSSLGNSGVQWLPEGYSFPAHLDEWLEIDWLDLDNVIDILDDESILFYVKLTDSDDFYS